MNPRFFKSQSDFRKWLDKHHDTSKELLVGFHKKNSGHPSITWPESVDEALCFGWIDGIRKSIDDISYTIRFTPRKPTSTWSAIFQAQPPSYRRAVGWWVVSAKKEETRLKRLQKLIEESAQCRRISQFTPRRPAK
jgi:uncharacterized protein YdeI (YjbR/CyaY-like superfamily)